MMDRMQGLLASTEIDQLLQSETFGHLGCCNGSKPYVVPMAYVCYENAIYGQTTTGKKLQVMSRNPQVCFQVESLRDKQWRSVICWGNFEELDFDDLRDAEAIEAVKLLTTRIGAIQENVGISIPFSFAEGAKPLKVNEKEALLFRISITEKTGRFFVTV